jgi:hypothetical protein
MLAAHRCGGRTDFRSFARAWDRFTGAGKRARTATDRELRTLTAQLEASLWEEDELRADTLRIDAPDGRPPRRRSSAWLGPFRRWDGYRDAVRQALGREQSEAEAREADERERERVGV